MLRCGPLKHDLGKHMGMFVWMFLWMEKRGTDSPDVLQEVVPFRAAALNKSSRNMFVICQTSTYNFYKYVFQKIFHGKRNFASFDNQYPSSQVTSFSNHSGYS